MLFRSVVLKNILTKHGRIIFNGNGYSEEWHKEAAKRGLKNLRTTPDALPEIVAKSSVEVFERQGVLSKAELESREEIYTHSYVLAINTESKLVSDIAKTLLLPAALKYAADLTPVEKTKSGGKDYLMSRKPGVGEGEGLERKTHGQRLKACATTAGGKWWRAGASKLFSG